MSKNSSGKYYQDNKDRVQKKLENDIKVFLKNIYMLVNNKKIYEKMKNKP